MSEHLFGRIWPLLAGVGWLLCAAPAQAMPLTFLLSPNSTEIEFSIDVFGLTSAEGVFRQFSGKLILDLDQPELTQVSMSIDSRSAAMDWPMAEAMMLGEDYLDAEHFPIVHFVGHQAEITGKDKIRISGLLTLRGVGHWENFDAMLVERKNDPALAADRAEFIATGILHRSDYNMQADHDWLDDRITLTLHTSLLVPVNLAPAP